jgi:hypothetical protein
MVCKINIKVDPEVIINLSKNFGFNDNEVKNMVIDMIQEDLQKEIIRVMEKVLDRKTNVIIREDSQEN